LLPILGKSGGLGAMSYQHEENEFSQRMEFVSKVKSKIRNQKSSINHSFSQNLSSMSMG